MNIVSRMSGVSAALLIGALLVGASAVGARPAPAQESTDLSKLLPAAGRVPGWKPDGEPLVYKPENLWEYIDGSAENFLSFDFRQVIAQDYVSAGDKGLKVEIYEHGSPLMAYGIYAQMRSPGLALHAIGGEGFSDEYSMSFWKDRFFVRVAVFEKGEASDAALALFAKEIEAAIPEIGAALPPETCAFPEEGLVPNDLRYLTQGVLGRESFPPAFVGTYRLGDEEGKLYLSTLVDSAAARDTFEWYTDGMKSFLATAEGPRGEYILGVGEDTYQGDVLVFSFGRYLGVLTGIKNPAAKGTEIVKKMVERLGRIDVDRKKAQPTPGK
jgi:hypothetical protein